MGDVSPMRSRGSSRGSHGATGGFGSLDHHRAGAGSPAGDRDPDARTTSDRLGAVDSAGCSGLDSPTTRPPVAHPYGGRIPAALGVHTAEAPAQGVQARPRGRGGMAGDDLSADREAGGGGRRGDPLGG